MTTEPDRPTAKQPRLLGRRRALQSGAAVLGGAGLGWTGAAAYDDPHAAAPAATPTAESPTGTTRVPFHGAHQAGVVTPPPAHLSLLGLDLRTDVDAAALGRLLSLLTDDAARLTQGRPALADSDPELATYPASLTVTFGFGPRVVNDVLPTGSGLTLDPLPPFETDALEERWGQTDLAIQLCADDPITVAHARRMLLKDSAAFARLRWIQEGFRNAPGTLEPGTTMRNLMGQVDGTVNPAPSDADFEQVVFDDHGGTTMVVRRIRMLLDTWDALDRSGKELAIGRRLADGSPLTGTREHDVPDLTATDSRGLPIIDPASHVARARGLDGRERILRRPYNYLVPDPSLPDGEDAGLVFIAYMRDVETQFVPIQARLAAQDRLNTWVTTIGSAVYAVPRGIPDPLVAPLTREDEAYVGQSLVAPRR